MKKGIALFLAIWLFLNPCSFAGTVTKTIGTDSRDYSTIASWEDDLDDGTNAANDPTAYQGGDDAVGECYADSEFTITAVITINGGTSVGLGSITLKAADGEAHPGYDPSDATSAVTIDGDGGAFAMMELQVSGIPVVVEDLILRHVAGSEYSQGVMLDFESTIRRCIIHDIKASGYWWALHGIYDNWQGVATKYAIRNILYDIRNTGSGSTTSRMTSCISGLNGELHAYGNIAHNCGTDNVITNHGSSCIGTLNTFENLENNMATSPPTGDCYSVAGVDGTEDYNLADDDSDSGTNSIGADDGVLLANLYVSTVEGSEDFHAQDGDADQIDAGSDLGTTQGVNIDIDGRDCDAEGDTWDIGADEYVSTALPGGNVIIKDGGSGQTGIGINGDGSLIIQ